jgi:hypothetical protein
MQAHTISYLQPKPRAAGRLQKRACGGEEVERGEGVDERRLID